MEVILLTLECCLADLVLTVSFPIKSLSILVFSPPAFFEALFTLLGKFLRTTTPETSLVT